MRFFMGLIILATGLTNIFYPSIAWYLREGWQSGGYSEPDDTFISITKLTGIVCSILGLGIFITGFLD
ncbi:hypothetical protein UB51_05795 [Paenibacillus sp. IHBB 10380]|nr:hypothetical protein UB51_05795 [Paenibacillus sp. IHBB 10380]